jgi:hypothetical protein
MDITLFPDDIHKLTQGVISCREPAQISVLVTPCSRSKREYPCQGEALVHVRTVRELFGF